MNPLHTDPTNHVLVVGGGLGGLASACTLAGRGHGVTLVEKNDWLGGKAAVLEGKGANGEGLRFDMGPTILTMPRVLGQVFREAGRQMEDYLELVRLDPQWRCFFDQKVGGGVLDLREDPPQMRESLKAFAAEPNANAANANANGDELADGYARFLDYAKHLERISEKFFFWKSVGGLRDVFDPKSSFNLSTLRDVMAMRMGSTMAGTIRRYVDEPRLAQLLDHFVQYVGSSPFGSPAILCSIAHMQTAQGLWYPKGGTRAVPAALERLARDLGVRIRTGVSVKRLTFEPTKTLPGRANFRVTGVETDAGEQMQAHRVVSNMDAVRTRRELCHDDAPTDGLARPGDREPACSGIVLYLGLDRAYEHLAHHNFIFSCDPQQEFESIYDHGEPAPDPTCYVACPAKTEPPGEVAPPGGEAMYVLVHTPYLRKHHDWSKDGAFYKQYRQTILDKLKRCGGMEDLEDRIVFEDALTPRDIHERYRVLNGAIYGLASHGRFTGAFKPGNRVRDIPGLYLAGGAAHPGPGMPLVLMSGWIAADCVDADMRDSQTTLAT